MDLVEKNSNTSLRHPWEIARLKIIFNFFEKYINHDDYYTILDMGCGDVYMAEKFIKKYSNIQYIGVDTAFTDEYINECNQNFKAQAIENIDLYKDINDIDVKKINKIDFIFLFDVIEHIDDDIGFLKKLTNYPLLSNECLIFITVPSYNCLFSSHDVFIKHFRRYNSKMLKNIATICNIEVVQNGTFFFVLLFPRIIKVIKEKFLKSNKNKGIGEWKSSRFITNIIVFILYLDYMFLKSLRLLGVNMPGLSNYMICKKSV
ncbi:MAG: class I SAM-dependent methyltransferase [Flavobacteriales bacterium]|nr:MAG: class I SAM-dependent methyltransferase [Flavobacteriales bacterium]|tara:strand:- start:1136 stop:1918 length:783 start_codon:yes stop_codon:yes gene_type:complete